MPRKPISLEVAKFLCVPFRVSEHNEIYRYVRSARYLRLERRRMDGRWVTSSLSDYHRGFAEDRWGLELWEEPPFDGFRETNKG